MGKGGGCMPSKHKASPVVSDRGQPLRSTDGSIPVEDQNPKKSEATFPFQDSSLRRTDASRKLRIFVVFYSMYRHVECLARTIKKGVDAVEGVLYRVPETLEPRALDQMKVPPKKEEIPVISVEELVEADGFLFGFPTRYGSMAGQMKAFFDSTGLLWREQELAGVPAGFFVSTATQGGGQETTISMSPILVNNDSSLCRIHIWSRHV